MTSLGGTRMFALDPRITLATGLVAQPGVYALLLGSGASSGAGIPTGWGVVEALVRQVAAASGDVLESTADWEAWWHLHANGGELGYSSLLEQLASTAPSRRAFLAKFFEPSAEDRSDGLKVPGPAHRAIAKLVARGTIRVIITTNFDRLIEQALDAEGVMPQVITTDGAVAGMEPLQHAQATVIKLHGDYASLDQRNTVEELSAYPTATAELLTRVLDEYGLIVSGWSGDWDFALVAAIEASANRRYPLYWTARGSLSDVAKRLTARSGAQSVPGVTADEFFPDLLSRVDAVEGLTEAPASLELKLGRLRRALPNPVRHLEVRGLFDLELGALRDWARNRPRSPDDNTLDSADVELDAISVRVRPILTLFATGIQLDRDRQHTDLWVWVLQQALNLRVVQAGSSTPWWDNLAHYPAFLLLRAGIMAALAAGHEEVAVRLAGEPLWRSIFVQQGEERPAHEVLHTWRVLDRELMEVLPRWGGTRYFYPASRLVRAHLTALAEELAGSGDGGERLLSRVEYRMALANLFIRPTKSIYSSPAAGEYLGTWPYREAEGDRTQYAADFLEHGDQAAWGRRGTDDPEFEAKIDALDERLRAIRRD